MSENVVSLTGATVQGRPSDKVVEALEQLLDEARRGEIVSIGVALIAPNNVINTVIAHSGQPTAHLLVAASCYLHHRSMQSAGIDD